MARIFFCDLFPNVPRESGLVVYVAQFSNGAVKVGRTANARQRMFSLKSIARRLFGDVDLVRVHVTEKQNDGEVTKQAEYAALRTISSTVAPVVGTAEFFIDFPFDKAVSIAEAGIVVARRSQTWRRRVRRARQRRETSNAALSA